MGSTHLRPIQLPTQTTGTIDHQASPGGAALHVVVGAGGQAYFACNNSTSGNVAFETADGVEALVVHNADPATNLGGKPVYAIEANSGQHNLLACVAVGGLTAGDVLRVAQPNGAIIEVLIVASIATYIAVNFKDDVGTASLRLRATLAGAADVTFKTSPRACAFLSVV